MKCALVFIIGGRPRLISWITNIHCTVSTLKCRSLRSDKFAVGTGFLFNLSSLQTVHPHQSLPYVHQPFHASSFATCDRNRTDPEQRVHRSSQVAEQARVRAFSACCNINGKICVGCRPLVVVVDLLLLCEAEKRNLAEHDESAPH